MISGIIMAIIWGLTQGLLPLFLFFEVFHFVLRKDRVSFPYIKGIIVSAIIGILHINHQHDISHGESGLVLLAFLPFFLAGYILSGLLPAFFYKKRGTTLLSMLNMGPFYKGLVIISVLLVLIVSFNSFSPFIWSGKVIDKDTERPIENVVITRSWERTYSTSHGTIGNPADFRKTLTDKEGRFVLFGKIYFPGIPVLSWVDEKRNIIYMPGYKSIDSGRSRTVIELEKVPTVMEIRKEELEAAKRRYKYYDYESELFKEITGRETDFLEVNKHVRRKKLTQRKRLTVKKKKQAYSAPAYTVRAAEIDKREMIKPGRASYSSRRTGAAILKHSMYRKYKQRTVQDEIAALNDKDGRKRSNAAKALGRARIPEAVEPLISALKDPNVSVRLSVIKSLLKQNDPRAVEPLINLLTDESSYVRNMARGALSIMDKPELEPFLEALGSDNSSVRASIVKILRSFEHDKRIINALIAAADDTDTVVLRTIAFTLGEYRDPVAVEVLVRVIKNSDISVRQRAVDALGKIKDKRMLGPLAEIMNDPYPDMRKRSVEALGMLKDKEAINTLIGAWDDPDSNVRRTASEVLIEQGQPAVEPLIYTLKHNDPYFRWRAAWALGKIGDTRATDSVIPLLQDRVSEVRWIAAEALYYLDDTEAVDSLETLLHDDDPGIRSQAQKAIRFITRETRND